mmetsp:Transcript_97484/g.232031  ORF Transcript_97484/g.232031 Transcript_97484/m.232031 type:complete len:333 (-) Transcript_97484:1328-2326(-)
MMAPETCEGEEVLQVAGCFGRGVAVSQAAENHLIVLSSLYTEVRSEDDANSLRVAAVHAEIQQRHLAEPFCGAGAVVDLHSEDLHFAIEPRRQPEGVRGDGPRHQLCLAEHLHRHKAGRWEAHHQGLFELLLLQEVVEALLGRFGLHELPFTSQRVLRASLRILRVLGAACEGDLLGAIVHHGGALHLPALHVIQVYVLIQRRQLFLHPVPIRIWTLGLLLHQLLPWLVLPPLQQLLKLFAHDCPGLLFLDGILAGVVRIQKVVLRRRLLMNVLWRLAVEDVSRADDAEVASPSHDAHAEDPGIQHGAPQRHHAPDVTPAMGSPPAAVEGLA